MSAAATTTATTNPNGHATVHGAGPTISTGGSNLPPRILFHGVEGIGKTSFAAFAPSPIFGMTGGETGLLTLIDHGLLGPTPHFDEFKSWEKLLAAIAWLTTARHDFKSFVIDTLNGAAALCARHVTEEKFSGKPEKYLNYGKGPEVAQTDWNEFLAALDLLRERKQMQIIALGHTKIKPFHNPTGDDFDRYTPDMHEKLWGLSAKWADVILFGNFDIIARKDADGQKAKGAGGQRRVLHTVRTAAWDAKNRVGLPNAIRMGNGGKEAWEAFSAAVRHESPPAAGQAIAPVVNGKPPARPVTPAPATIPYPTPPIPVTTPLPATSPPPGASPSQNVISAKQLSDLADLRSRLFDLCGMEAQARPDTWKAILSRRGAASARELTAVAAAELIAKLAFQVNAYAKEKAANAATEAAERAAIQAESVTPAVDHLSETATIVPKPTPLIPADDPNDIPF